MVPLRTAPRRRPHGRRRRHDPHEVERLRVLLQVERGARASAEDRVEAMEVRLESLEAKTDDVVAYVHGLVGADRPRRPVGGRA